MARPISDDSAPAGAFELTLDEMGAQGDAIGFLDGRKVFLAHALAGERVIAVPRRMTGGAIWADPWRVIVHSRERVLPPCRHSGTCGGCKLQHWRESAYRSWKLGLVESALGARKLAPPGTIEGVFIPEGTRRRAELAARRRGDVCVLGFHGGGSHDIVDISECHVLTPPLMALLPGLRWALRDCLDPGQSCDILLTATESGPDMLITARDKPNEGARARLIDFAREAGVARICWRRGEAIPDIVCRFRVPQVSFDGMTVALPAPSFLQPTLAGEAALRAIIMRGLGQARSVAELFCGCGTFTFAIARQAKVLAVDGAKPAIEALSQAARTSGLTGNIEPLHRDLERSPLSVRELRRFEAIVLDPPRGGAKAQSLALAKSGVDRIVYVSCSPSSFARDARVLVDGGFALSQLSVIDQFLWSAHLELVAEFRR